MKKQDKFVLIKKLLEISKIEQNKNLQGDPSFFDIIGRANDEDLISRMLAYVLKRDKIFVWELFKYYGTFKTEHCPTDFKIISVECEKTMSNGRADIFVIASCNDRIYTLTIENKIYRWEHDEQTQTYYNFVSQNYREEEKGKRNAYLFLKPEFNASPVSCNNFTVINYNKLLTLISETDDYSINDFKKHIKEHLEMTDIEFSEADRQVLDHLIELREILSSTESKLTNFKRQLFKKLGCNSIIGLNYNPYDTRKNKEEKDAKCKENNDLIIQIADNETSFRIYKADVWNRDTYDENGYYFYVELKFDENNPNNILFQKVAKQYGKYELSIVTRFIKHGDFGVELENPSLDGQYKPYFVFSSKRFKSVSQKILSEGWQDELFDFAQKTLMEDIDKMNIIVAKFKKWNQEKI